MLLPVLIIFGLILLVAAIAMWLVWGLNGLIQWVMGCVGVALLLWGIILFFMMMLSTPAAATDVPCDISTEKALVLAVNPAYPLPTPEELAADCSKEKGELTAYILSHAAPSVPVTNPQAAPTSTPTRGEVIAPPGICRNKPGNEGGESNTIIVEPGHMRNVQWYESGWSTHTASILPEGTYHPKEGVMIGAWWDYDSCTLDKVEGEAIASVGALSEWSNGFTKE